MALVRHPSGSLKKIGTIFTSIELRIITARLNPMPLPELTAEEHAIYEWQIWVPGVGDAGQRKLKAASVLISRVGGLGGLVALELAAAGVGKLVLAHGGELQPSDLNRQLLQTHDHIGKPRIDNGRRPVEPFAKWQQDPFDDCVDLANGKTFDQMHSS